MEPRPRARRGLATRPRSLTLCDQLWLTLTSILSGTLTSSSCSAEAELAAEQEQQHQHDDDQQDDGENSAAAAAAAGFHYGRAFDVVAIIVGHGNSPCLTLLLWRNEP